MGLPWCFRGASWYFGDIPRIRPWVFHGISVGLRSPHGASVVFPWDLHGTSMIRNFRGTSEISWDFRGASMVYPWCSRGLHWGFHGFFVIP